MVVVWSEERVREKEGDDERKREKVAAENPSIPLMSESMDKVKHKKLEAFYKRILHVPEEDANCIASTSNLEQNPSGDQTVQPDEQPCKIQKAL
ncbi:hypothetical protein MTR_7g112070 [Medicago truncatula]|uniref:Uncharacterized protein n=1 Tax=Medicago truncatula TaxID=3880 RepID=A0A072U417_MEDTR|nr:hypothetical protein MTR_7g112070 [Medicago truncatula]